MLEAPRSRDFSVTETFALYSSVLCWVIQHVRIGKDVRATSGDARAAELAKELEQVSIIAEPWRIPLVPRVVTNVAIPEARGYGDHKALRFLKNLRDAAAHGDARNVEPFHSLGRGANRKLLGFTFECAEIRDRKLVWGGEITLLESDMRRIASTLAELLLQRHQRKFRWLRRRCPPACQGDCGMTPLWPCRATLAKLTGRQVRDKDQLGTRCPCFSTYREGDSFLSAATVSGAEAA